MTTYWMTWTQPKPKTRLYPMTRYQTAACIVVAAVNIASLVVIALAVYGARDARINEKRPRIAQERR